MAGRSSRLIFGACAIISGAAAMFGMNALPVMAVEDVGAKEKVSALRSVNRYILEEFSQGNSG